MREVFRWLGLPIRASLAVPLFLFFVCAALFEAEMIGDVALLWRFVWKADW